MSHWSSLIFLFAFSIPPYTAALMFVTSSSEKLLSLLIHLFVLFVHLRDEAKVGVSVPGASVHPTSSCTQDCSALTCLGNGSLPLLLTGSGEACLPCSLRRQIFNMSGFGMWERGFNTIISGMLVFFYSAFMSHVAAATLETPNAAWKMETLKASCKVVCVCVVRVCTLC